VCIKYVQFLFDQQESRSRAVHALLGLQVAWPHLKGRLGQAWDTVRCWGLLEPIVLRTPLPFPLWRCLVVFSLLHAFVLDRGRADVWLQLLLFLYLGFQGLLRPGEALRLARRHLSLPADFAVGMENCLAICIENPKTRASGGRVQHVLVSDPAAVQWISWLVAGLKDQDPLFTITGPVLRRRFAELCKFGHFEGFKLTPASLRAGGATHLYIAGVPIDRLRFMGRWRVLSSLEHYVQEAAAVMCLQKLPQGARNIAALVSDFWAIFAFPPHVGRQTLVCHGSSRGAPRLLSQG